MPQPTRTDRWLAQVTTPSDGLPDPSSCWTAQYGPSLPAPSGLSPKPRRQRRTSEPWVKGSSRWIGFPQEAPSTPMPRAAVASSKANGMKREWCPESLVVPDTLRRTGRTETLTGQASHTSSRAKGRKQRGNKGEKWIEPGEECMRDLNYELKQLCNRNRDGSYATQHDRERVLDQIANQLQELGFRHMVVAGLKPKHVEGLVERWKMEGLWPSARSRIGWRNFAGGPRRSASRTSSPGTTITMASVTDSTSPTSARPAS
jgi:hypothetical protein